MARRHLFLWLTRQYRNKSFENLYLYKSPVLVSEQLVSQSSNQLAYYFQWNTFLKLVRCNWLFPPMKNLPETWNSAHWNSFKWFYLQKDVNLPVMTFLKCKCSKKSTRTSTINATTARSMIYLFTFGIKICWLSARNHLLTLKINIFENSKNKLIYTTAKEKMSVSLITLG